MGTIRDEIIELVQRSVQTFSSIENVDRQLSGLHTLNQMKRDLARNRIKEALHEIQVYIAKQAAEDLLELSTLVKEREDQLNTEKENLRTTKEMLLNLLQETKAVITARPAAVDQKQAELLRDKMKQLVETDYSPLHLEAFSYLEFISHPIKPEELCVGYLRTGALDPRQMSLNEIPGQTEQILEVGQAACLWLDTGAPISCQDLMKHTLVTVTGPDGDALACKMFEKDSQMRIGFNVKEEGPYIVDVKVYNAHVSPCPMTMWAMNRETSKGIRANIMRSIDHSPSHKHISVEASSDFLRTDEAELDVFENEPSRPEPVASPVTSASPTPRVYGPRARRLSSPMKERIGPPPGFQEISTHETSHVKERPGPPGFLDGHLGFVDGAMFSRLTLEDKKKHGLSVETPQQTTNVSPPKRNHDLALEDVPPIVIQPVEPSPLKTTKVKLEPVVEKPSPNRWSPQRVTTDIRSDVSVNNHTAIPSKPLPPQQKGVTDIKPAPSDSNHTAAVSKPLPPEQKAPIRTKPNSETLGTLQPKELNIKKNKTVKDIPLPKDPNQTVKDIPLPKEPYPVPPPKEKEPPEDRSFADRDHPKQVQRSASKELSGGGDHNNKSSPEKMMPSFSYLTNLLNLRHGSGTDIPAKLTLELGKRGTGTPYVFAFPIGIATSRSRDNPDIVACDTGNNLVKIFTWAGKFKKALGTEESGVGFRRPSAVVVDKAGDIFVKDDRMIQKFSSEGDFIMRIGDRQLNKPYGLKLTQDGVLVTLDHRLRALVLFDAASGKLVRTMPFAPLVSGTDPRFRFLTVHDDKVAVVNLGEHEVIIASLKDGRVITRMGSFGNGPGQFREPSGATVDSHGNLLVADSKNNRIQVFDMEGSYQGKLHLDSPVLRPSDIHVMEDGHLIVDSYLQHCLKVFKLG